jgi:SAM-dependent methyltransferase
MAEPTTLTTPGGDAAATALPRDRAAAERYEAVLVPTILGPAARALVAHCRLKPGQSVLDVGCGTGAATAAAAAAVGFDGRVVGLDASPAMLAVAAARRPGPGPRIEWLEGRATDIPLAGHEFDAVLCAQVLQFVDDRPQALAEIRRTLVPGGRLALGAWCALEKNPYFEALIDAIGTHLGADAAAGLDAACGWHDIDSIRAQLDGVGFEQIDAIVARLDIELPPLPEFVARHLAATSAAAAFEAAPDARRAAIARDVAARLAGYQTGTGVCVPFRTHLVRACA